MGRSPKINLIAIAGGSASGKTTVAEKIGEACNKKMSFLYKWIIIIMTLVI
nr:hypothetical protein [Spiroplasma ixodetis]